MVDEFLLWFLDMEPPWQLLFIGIICVTLICMTESLMWAITLPPRCARCKPLSENGRYKGVRRRPRRLRPWHREPLGTSLPRHRFDTVISTTEPVSSSTLMYMARARIPDYIPEEIPDAIASPVRRTRRITSLRTRLRRRKQEAEGTRQDDRDPET